MKHRIDVMRLREGTMTLNGWVIPRGQKGRNYIDISDRLPGAEREMGTGMQAASADGVRFSVKKKTGAGVSYVPFSYVPMLREDVAGQFHCSSMCGFSVEFPYEHEAAYVLEMEAPGGGKACVPVSDAVMAKRGSVAHRKREKLLALCTAETVQVAWDYLRANGLRALWKKSVHKLRGIEEDYDYPEWYEKTKLSEEEKERQRARYAALAERVRAEGPVRGEADQPFFSVVVPAYNTPEKYLVMLLDSLKAQTYPNFELVVADGSDSAYTAVSDTLRRYEKTDQRFRCERLSGNHGISENTNAAIRFARGEYIVLCDHDDELTENALYEVAEAIREHPSAEFFYTDEDKMDFDGKALFEPHFKSDFNPDLLRTVNYICHLSVIRRSLLARVQAAHPEGLLFDPAYDGAQDHDFFLRCTEEAVRAEQKEAKERRSCGEDSPACAPEEMRAKVTAPPGDGVAAPVASEAADAQEKDGGVPALRDRTAAGLFTSARIIHIPKVCYHWRCHKDSTSANPEAKLYAFEAGKRAVLAHERRIGMNVKEVVDGVTYGFYHTIYPASETKISVIIPNKDHRKDLDLCIRSVIQRSLHRNLEFIIVENNSTEEETFSYYKEIEQNPAYFMSDFDEAYARLLSEREAARRYAKTVKNVTDTWEPEISKEALSDLSRISIHTVYWEREFNYSAINNFGVQAATGDALLFLNNDVELINPASFTEMLGILARPEVGIVGARLLYEDNTVQHAGVVVGFGGIAGGAFIGLHERENSYMHRMMCTQDYSAVTAACLMTKRAAFLGAGGFCEELAVAFNDIDYCMKIRAQGLLCVYDPYVLLHHYESKSRGLEDTPEKVARFNGEIAVFASRWPEILAEGDPYYNPNLTLRKSNFSLRDLTKENIGEPYHLELDVEKQLREVRKAKRIS